MSEKWNERGFTLVELMVVVFVIAVLAAIVLPVFLNQRAKAWDSQGQSVLKNMAFFQEAYFAEPINSTYATRLGDLTALGFKYSGTQVRPSIVSASVGAFCLRTESLQNPAIVWFYDSDTGLPSTSSRS